MNKMTKKIIPDLRFPEFVDDKTWAQKAINDIAISQSSSVALNKLILKDNGFPVYGADSIVGYIDKFQQKDIYVSIVKDGSGVGRLNLCVKESSVLGTLAYIKSKDAEEYNIIWIYYLLNTIDFTKYIKGAGIPHIYFTDFKEERIAVPTPKEQQKIASCLSSLDELITAQKEKIELLKNHKKGLMQNLFPQEGETVPKFRFPEFENDGAWKPTTVEKNCVLKGRIGYRGYTKEDLVRKAEGAIVLGGKHIQNQLLYLADPTFLSWEKYYESPEIMVEKNHIIFSQRGSLGDCAIIDKEIGKATINPSMVLMKNFKCVERFLYYVLIGGTIQREVARVSSLAAIPMLSQKQIKEFPFHIPLPKEQKKIAICLSFLDNLISAQTEKIEQLQLHKKGLMQGLFPKIID